MATEMEPVKRDDTVPPNGRGAVALAPVQFAGPLSGDPEQVIEKATAIAKRLKSIVEEGKLYTAIRDKKHVHVEGWTTMCAMLGIFPRTDWTRPIQQPDGKVGWEARVTFVHLSSGREITSGEAMCSPDEDHWKDAEQYAIRSMAETRATAKAAKLGFSWIITLAGYSATPAEEMSGVREKSEGARQPASEGVWIEANEAERKRFSKMKNADFRANKIGARWRNTGTNEQPTFVLEILLPPGVSRGMPETPLTDLSGLDKEIEAMIGKPGCELSRCQAFAVKSGVEDGDWKRLTPAQKQALLGKMADAAAIAAEGASAP